MLHESVSASYELEAGALDYLFRMFVVKSTAWEERDRGSLRCRRKLSFLSHVVMSPLGRRAGRFAPSPLKRKPPGFAGTVQLAESRTLGNAQHCRMATS